MGLVRSSGRPVEHVAAELGINAEALRQWVRKAEAAEVGDGGDGLSVGERVELLRLRAGLVEVVKEKEKGILRRAAACFAREMGH